MKTQLPKFEGSGVPKAARLKLTGNSDERVGALALGEEVYLIIRGVVSNVDHGSVGNVFARTHKVKASSVVFIDREQGERMLDEAAMLADERFGIRNLFAEGPSGDGGDDE